MYVKGKGTFMTSSNTQHSLVLVFKFIEIGKLKIYYFQRRGYWGNGFIPLPPPKFNYKIYKRVKMLKYIIEILKYIVEILKYIVEMLKYIKEILKYRIKILK